MREITIVLEVSGKNDKEDEAMKTKSDQEIASMVIEGNRIDMIDNWWLQDEH